MDTDLDIPCLICGAETPHKEDYTCSRECSNEMIRKQRAMILKQRHTIFKLLGSTSDSTGTDGGSK